MYHDTRVQDTMCIRIEGIVGYRVYHDTGGFKNTDYRVYQDMNFKIKLLFLSFYMTIQIQIQYIKYMYMSITL